MCALRTFIGKCNMLIIDVCIDYSVDPYGYRTLMPVIVYLTCTHGVFVQK